LELCRDLDSGGGSETHFQYQGMSPDSMVSSLAGRT